MRAARATRDRRRRAPSAPAPPCVEGGRRRLARRPPGRLRVGRLGRACDDVEPIRPQRRARGLDARRPAQARARTAAAAPGVCELRRGRRCPPEELLRRRVADDRSIGHRDHPVRRGQAALEPVLGEHDRRVGVLVEPPQQRRTARRPRPDPAARSARRARSAPAARRARRRARRAGARRPTARRSDGRAGARSRARAPPPRPPRATAGAGSPRFSSGNASSARTVPITTCVSGSWNSVPTAAASSPGPCSRVSIPATDTRPASTPPWKWGTSPLAARSRVDLPDPDAAGEHDELAGADRQARPRRSAGRRASGIPVAHPFELEHVLAHRCTPRRSANGSSAHASSAAATAIAPAPTGACSDG